MLVVTRPQPYLRFQLSGLRTRRTAAAKKKKNAKKKSRVSAVKVISIELEERRKKSKTEGVNLHRICIKMLLLHAASAAAPAVASAGGWLRDKGHGAYNRVKGGLKHRFPTAGNAEKAGSAGNAGKAGSAGNADQLQLDIEQHVGCLPIGYSNRFE